MNISGILDKRWYGGLYHLHNTNDTWEQWTTEFEPWYHYPVGVKDKIVKIFSNNLEHIRNKFVVDLACNLGYLTLAASNLGASKALGLEIRDTYLETFNKVIKHWPQQNASVVKTNIEELDALAERLQGVDTIIYAGHLYHTSQNESILEVFTTSSANCLIIESVIPTTHTNGYFETTELESDPLNGFVDDKTDVIKIRIPTPEKTKLLLEELGWKVARIDPIQFCTPARYVITAIRNI